MLAVGTRVKPSESALRPARDYWQSCGSEPQKSRAKQWYLDKMARRGVILKAYNNGYADSYDIQWDDGYSSCMTHMVVEAAELTNYADSKCAFGYMTVCKKCVANMPSHVDGKVGVLGFPLVQCEICKEKA